MDWLSRKTWSFANDVGGTSVISDGVNDGALAHHRVGRFDARLTSMAIALVLLIAGSYVPAFDIVSPAQARCSDISGTGGGGQPCLETGRPRPPSNPPRYSNGGGGYNPNYGDLLGTTLGILGTILEDRGGGGGGSCRAGYGLCSGGGCAPLGSVCCGNGRFCQRGNICTNDGKCLSLNSPSVCSNRRSYCSDGSVCTNEGNCLASDSPRVCSNGRNYCKQGSFCDNGSCYSMDSPRFCGDGTFCSQGEFCDNDSLCYSTTEARYCGSGRFCDSGYFCDRNMPEGSSRCVPTSSARYCGDGAYCKEGTMCTDDNMCVAQNDEPPPSQSSDGRELTSADCSCISILPQSQVGSYQVTNSCGPLSVSVKFGGDTLHLSARTDAFTDWEDAGVVSPESPGFVRSPSYWTMTSILGMSLASDVSTFTCMF